MDGFAFNLSGGETLEEKEVNAIGKTFFASTPFSLSKEFYEAPESEIILDDNGSIIWRGSRLGN